MKKRILCVAVITLISIVLLGSQEIMVQHSYVSAQEGSPSLEETMKWLRSTVNSKSGIRVKQYTGDGEFIGVDERSTEIVRINNCEIVLKVSGRQTINGQEERSEPSEYKLNLSKMSPDFFKVKKVNWDTPGALRNEGDHPFYSIGFVYFKDEETAERVGKAYKHAVKLCGGKPEPF